MSCTIFLDVCFPVADADEPCNNPEAPEFSQTLTSQTVIDGQPARMECTVRGNPTPNIWWFRQGTLIPPSTDFLQFYDDVENTCSLEIKEIYPEDHGRYTVVAKNIAGTATCSAELQVEEGDLA